MAANPDTIINPYHVLEIEKTATDKEIRKAYRTLALKLHPDKNKAPEAEDQFKRLLNAYDLISTPAKREEYDRSNFSYSVPGTTPTSARSSFSSSFQKSQFKFQDGVKVASLTSIGDMGGIDSKSKFMSACHEDGLNIGGLGEDFFTLIFSDLEFRLFDTPSQERFKSLRRPYIQPSTSELLRNFILFPSDDGHFRLLVGELENQKIDRQKSAIIIVTTLENHELIYEAAKQIDLSTNVIKVDFNKPTQKLIGHSSETIAPEIEKRNIGVLVNIMDKLVEVMGNLGLIMSAESPTLTSSKEQGFFITKKENKNDRDDRDDKKPPGCTIS